MLGTTAVEYCLARAEMFNAVAARGGLTDRQVGELLKIADDWTATGLRMAAWWEKQKAAKRVREEGSA